MAEEDTSSPTYAKARNRLAGQLGTYWIEGFADKEDPISLIRGAESETGFADVFAESRAWASRHRSTVIRNYTIRWEDYHVLYFGVDRQKRIVTAVGSDDAQVFSKPDAETYATVHGVALQTEDTNHVFGDEDNRLLFFPESDGAAGGILVNSANLQPRYLLNIGRDIEPTLIQAKDRMLVNGIDFYRSGEWLVFHQSMNTLFPDGAVHIRTGFRRQPDLYGYLEGTDGNSASMLPLVKYSKEASGVRNFARAALSVAGIPLLDEDDLLLRVLDLNWPNKRYVYSNRVIQTRYPHLADNTGVTFPKDHAPGSVARVFSRRHQGIDWWKQVNWSDGFPLLNGEINLTRANIEFEAVEDVGGEFHIRNTVVGALGGDAAAENNFWNIVHDAEERSGNWLNDLLDPDGNPFFGFTSTGDASKSVRFLDVLMHHSLRNRVLVFELDGVAVTEGDKVRFEHYVHEERPADVIPVIRYRYHNESV